MSMSYFEDVTEGEVHDLGDITIEREEMIAFAEQYDPQPIHTDPTFAEDTMYGGVIASGWFTACLCMRQFAEQYLTDVASMGAFGVEQLRWAQPVRPDDRLSVSIEILNTRSSESYADRGYVTNEIRAMDDEGDIVISWQATNIFLRRDE